jgi:hypothetical protein
MAELTDLLWQEVMEEKAIHEWQEWLSERIDMPKLKSPYTDSRCKAPVCCPSCYEAVDTPYVQCLKCGLMLDVSMMHALRDNAFELAAYAWNYRNRYEKDIKKGKIYQRRAAVKYFLPPPGGWLVYLASIVLAAILGGLSYDAFKKLLSKLAGKFSRRFSRQLPQEKELRQFYDRLREYFLARRNPDSPVFRAYVQGLITFGELKIYLTGLADLETLVEEAIEEPNKGRPSEIVASESEIFPEREPPTDVEVRKHIEELLKESVKVELQIKRLQRYLQRITSKRTGDQGLEEK